MNIVRDFSRCPRCGAATTKSIAINEGESEWWYECSAPKCNTYINTYIPQEHQEAFHQDSHRFVGNFGGYGTGKTLTSRQELYKHIFLTRNANVLIGANVTSQYEQTIKRDIEADLPKAFVRYISTQKAYIDLVNGARIMFRPFDDPEKLRSYNLTMFIIIEGSECKQASFNQLKTRLRNTFATIPKRDEQGNVVYRQARNGVMIPEIAFDWRKGIVESNPDSGWIRSDVLMVANEINKHGRIPDIYHQAPEDIDPATSCHISETGVNEFLPPNFISEICKNKPKWWVNRYIKGSFLYSEGTIYPEAMSCVITAFPPKQRWLRIVAFDYGLVDDSVFLFGGIDEEENLLYIYKEIRSNDKSVETLAKLFHEASREIPVGSWVCQPIIDPKSGPRRDYEKKTLSDHFAEYGIYFKPGHIAKDARIFRLNTYIETGRLRIMDCCPVLIKELKNYKFKLEGDELGGYSDKPEDKNDHGISALEWITMELPADPNKLIYGVYGKGGLIREDTPLTSEAAIKSYAMHVLSDEEQANYDNYSMIAYEL